ncbi:hypothetical protein LG296_07135 [Ureibacillus chungkukjangi]|uniref:hypothetical protein n=1 Tax=Ureibacillus chungkukjangi TaxID=1202712 RepID=UPI00384F1FC4
MKVRRIRGFVIDFLLSIAFCIILSILAFLVIAVITLLFLPFVASYGETWNPILSAIINGLLLLGFLAFVVTSLGVNFKFTLTWGYKLNGLMLGNSGKLRLFTWWFIRNGIAGLFIFICAYHRGNNMDSDYLLLPIALYIFYLGIDGIVFFLTNGKKTLTDIWTGIEVLETSDVVNENTQQSLY